MSYRQMHLNKGGAGMSARTACGRNILRTPMSTDWGGFKAEPAEHQCEKCAASAQARLNARRDEQAALDEWVPEHPDAWKAADDAYLARRRAVA